MIDNRVQTVRARPALACVNNRPTIYLTREGTWHAHLLFPGVGQPVTFAEREPAPTAIISQANLLANIRQVYQNDHFEVLGAEEIKKIPAARVKVIGNDNLNRVTNDKRFRLL